MVKIWFKKNWIISKYKEIWYNLIVVIFLSKVILKKIIILTEFFFFKQFFEIVFEGRRQNHKCQDAIEKENLKKEITNKRRSYEIFAAKAS